MKEQMDGSARPLYDKNVESDEDGKSICDHHPRSPSRPFAISPSSDDLGHTVRKSPVQLKLPLKTCQFNVVHTESPPCLQNNTGVCTDVSSLSMMYFCCSAAWLCLLSECVSVRRVATCLRRGCVLWMLSTC